MVGEKWKPEAFIYLFLLKLSLLVIYLSIHKRRRKTALSVLSKEEGKAIVRAMNRNYCLGYHGNPPMSVEELMDIQPQQVELQMGPDIGLCQDFYFSGSGGNNLKLEKQEQLMWKQQDYMYNESDTIHVLNSSDHFQQEHQEIDQCLRLQVWKFITCSQINYCFYFELIT